MSKLNKAFFKPCALSKSNKLPFISNNISAPFPFYLIHSNVWMSSTSSLSSFPSYVLFPNDHSRYSWILPMRAKSEVFTHFESLCNMVKNNLSPPLNSFKLMVVHNTLIVLLNLLS